MLRILIIVLLVCRCATAATYTAANASIAAVSNALALCGPVGDIVQIPAGTVSWTNGLYITNAVTILGAGRGITIISNAIPDATAVNYRHPFNFNLNSHSSTSWLANLTITEDPSQTANVFSTGVLAEGDNRDGRRIAITNVHFYSINGFALTIESALGVVADSQFDATTVAVYGYHRVWNGGTLGHGAWATNDNFGTDQFFYIERCGFNFLTPGFTYTTVDGYAGWRFVARYCNFTNTTLEGHGPETSSGRGTRAVEAYMNYFTNNAGGQTGTFTRSGPQVFWSNSFAGLVGTTPFKLPYYRTYELLSLWGPANGTNGYDTNIAGVAYSGTVSSTNAVDIKAAGVTVSGTPFTANQYRGYSITRTSDLGGNGNNYHSIILSNSTATLYYALGELGTLKFATSDTFELRKVDKLLDGHGIGKGSLLTGENRFSNFNDQELSPCYEWANLNEFGQNMDFETNAFNLNTIQGTHYYKDTEKPGYSPFTYPHPILTGQAPADSVGSSPRRSPLSIPFRVR